MAVQGKIATPIGQRLKRARVGVLPLAIWGGAVFLAMKLWLAGPSMSTYMGLAHSTETNITCPVDGAVGDILVELYETVATGQPLVTIQDEGLQAAIETAQAELTRLSAEVSAQRAALEVEEEVARREEALRYGQATSVASLEVPSEMRAFHTDETSLELRILDTQLAITTSELEADRLDVELQRARSMAESQVGPLIDVEGLEKRLALERGRSDSLRLIEARANIELVMAQDRRRAVEAGYEPPPMQELVDPALEARLAGWKTAILVQHKRVAELALRREAYVLKAPSGGRVAALVASAGQFLSAGDPVLVLMDSESREVALWVPEWSPSPPRLGDRLLVTHPVEPDSNAVAECVVQAMSPGIELMPQRLWRDGRVAEYGRAVLIGPVAALKLVPGERVRIDPLGEGSFESR